MDQRSGGASGYGTVAISPDGPVGSPGRLGSGSIKRRTATQCLHAAAVGFAAGARGRVRSGASTVTAAGAGAGQKRPAGLNLAAGDHHRPLPSARHQGAGGEIKASWCRS